MFNLSRFEPFYFVYSLVFPEERELTSMQGIIDIKVISSLLLKPINLKIENIAISYKNFSLKCQQHMFMVDNIGNTENAKKKKGSIISQPREPNHC